MIKKILISIAASAFALTLSAPIASACDGMDKKVVKKEKKQDDKKVADKSKSKAKTKTKDKAKKKKTKKGAKVSKG